MSKIRIHLAADKVSDLIEIKEREIIHKLKDVLSLKQNDKIYIFNGEGDEYLYSIKDVRKNYIIAKKDKLLRQENNSKQKVALGFPLVKEEKIDFILQKATELGVAEFVPFICERSIREKPSLNKLARWKKIVIEATRQSQRLWLPKIAAIKDFKEIVKNDYKIKLAASVTGKDIRETIDRNSYEIFVIVGPEGDFSVSEYTALKENNFQFIKLSKNILRVETASMFTVGLLNYLLYES